MSAPAAVSLFSDLNNASLLLRPFILSILSWKFVEKPFRTSQIKGRIVMGSFISWAVILIFSGLFSSVRMGCVIDIQYIKT